MQMTRDEIISKLGEILEETLGERAADFSEESGLMDGLGLTSVDMLYLIIATEESFGIRFRNIGIMDLKTVGEVADYIEAALR